MENIKNLKEQIIHEFMKLFSVKGFLSTSIHDIMREAKTFKGFLPVILKW